MGGAGPSLVPSGREDPIPRKRQTSTGPAGQARIVPASGSRPRRAAFGGLPGTGSAGVRSGVLALEPPPGPGQGRGHRLVARTAPTGPGRHRPFRLGQGRRSGVSWGGSGPAPPPSAGGGAGPAPGRRRPGPPPCGGPPEGDAFPHQAVGQLRGRQVPLVRGRPHPSLVHLQVADQLGQHPEGLVRGCRRCRRAAPYPPGGPGCSAMGSPLRVTSRPTRSPTTRPSSPGPARRTSGFFFWGMMPSRWRTASGSSTKPNSAAPENQLLGPAREVDHEERGRGQELHHKVPVAHRVQAVARTPANPS